MFLEFIGAAHEVTGSCHFLEIGGKRLLVDCGMEQGTDVYENQELPVNAGEIDYILLTHAHIDHTGLVPLMYARGFRGRIYSTGATKELCDIMLRDSAHIQMFEAEWKNRKAKRSGMQPVEPLYTMEDAFGAMKLFVPCEYGEKIAVDEGITIRFTDVGHLLGSSSIEVWAEEDGKQVKLVFSGDIGNKHQPILKDPIGTDRADYVIMESTYGDRSHGMERVDYVRDLAAIIQRTLDRGGNVVIPAFAVGRTQELLYFIRKIKKDNLVTGHDGFPVYIDSPLAIEATTIFHKNVNGYFDEEAMELVHQGINPISFPGLKTAITSEESKMINFNTEPKVIISASGMCEAGRIRHHLKHNLWRPQSTVVFVGYQAVGTLGRTLLEGATDVKLFGEPVEIQAEICKLDGISGHADKEGLINWVTQIEDPQKVFVVHGEDTVCEAFAECLKKEHGLDAEAPFSGYCYDLINGTWVEQAEPVFAKKKEKAKKRKVEVFERLLAAGQRLLSVIKRNEGGANKDLAKFADQINMLCDKWDR